MSKVIYVGAFLDVDSIWRLLAWFPPHHSNVFAEHVTLCFKPTRDELDWWAMFLGDEVDVVVQDELSDDRGQAVLVKNMKSKNKDPHVTISCAPGTKPVYSNELIAKGRDEKEFWPTAELKLRAVIDTFPRGAILDTTKGERAHG